MKQLLIALVILTTTACGWQLRGITQLPASVQVMTLESQAGNRFTQRLKQQLTFNGVVFPSDGSANVRLMIAPISIERLTLSVNSRGQAAEYELNAELNVRLIQLEEGTDTQWIITGRRIFSNDINSVIATQSEEKIQREELENDLIRKLMNRLKKAQLK
ncbi:LPS-assembly lipoprotein [Oleispira antarctica RB-8]|uniref:LPS-assembly lipoprotein LptE n=1 Tax=Oleispira antarctica RB-8 TaxID=698738 RepID=R4YRF2_OLEAN|nr:LPS-assembly lipoprotein [Oleispira antarctica RB-8]